MSILTWYDHWAMKNTSDFRRQCALLGITRDTIDSNIIIVPEPKFWRARDMSDVDWPGMGKRLLLQQLEEQEIPCKLEYNGDDIEYRALEVEYINALAFISTEIIKTVGAAPLLNWINDRFGWAGTKASPVPIHVELELLDGHPKRLTATTNTVEEADLLLRSFFDKR